MNRHRLPPYRASLAGTLLGAREAVMAPIRPILREADVTEQQWRVLRVLAYEGPTEPSALADHALLHAPSVTRILKELVERNLIMREADPVDRRRAILTLSDQGHALVDRTAEHTSIVLARYAEVFGRDRLNALLAELVAFTRAIGPEGSDD